MNKLTLIKEKLLSFLNLKMVKNGLWLYILQLFNTVVPLLTVPYITRILGPSQYGIFSSALNIITYFQVIVEYGFNLSGTRKVAINRYDIDKISNVYSRITFSKVFLCIISLALLILISLIFNISGIKFLTMLVLYVIVIGTVFQQTWLFQGLEEMKFITLASVISRSMSVFLIFLFVKKDNQILLYSTFYALTYLLMGIISLIIIKFKYKIKLAKIKFFDIIEELKDGWYLFTTSAMSRIFNNIGITILVFTSTETIVGGYTAIQKIPLVLQMLFTPIGQVIYPYISKEYSKSFNCGIKKVKLFFKYIVSFFIFVGFIIIINARSVVEIFFGVDYVQYSQLLIPLIIWMILSIINNLLGIQILVASGHIKEYSISFRIGVISIILLNAIFGYFFDAKGIAIAAMIAELILTVAIVYHILKVINS